jgi:hypothetical protein
VAHGLAEMENSPVGLVLSVKADCKDIHPAGPINESVCMAEAHERGQSMLTSNQYRCMACDVRRARAEGRKFG